MFSILVAAPNAIFRHLMLILALVVGIGVAPAAAQTTPPENPAPSEYTLGVDDQIVVRMVAWDATALAFVRFSEIEGDYTIGADGRLLMPLVGPLTAAGKTPSTLADEITTAMQLSIGLVEAPSTTVEVRTYRPVYVMGDVQRPGAYEFRPGLRADQALALAGGLSQADALGSSALRNLLRDEGALKDAEIQQVQLAIRAARLQAETSGADNLERPANLTHPEGDSALDEVFQREETLFASRRQSLERALSSFDETAALLETEVAALETKLSGLNRQETLISSQVEAMEQLLERGLARSPTLVALQSSQIDLQARQTDVETALFRAQQAITEVARDRISLETQRQENALAELQNARSQLAQSAARIDMLKALEQEGAENLASISENLEEIVTFSITRDDGTVPGVTRTSRLQPLDVIEVLITLPEDE